MADVYRFLRTPRWAVASSVVVALTVAFVNLGTWQLDRMQERRLANEVDAARLASEPAPLDELIGSVGGDVASLEYRRATVVGTFAPRLEALVRSMTHGGEAGFHVLTPLQTEAGTWVIVNRGWVPLEFDTPPVAASPPEGVVEIAGLARLGQTRSGVGPTDPPGARVVSRVDLEHLAASVDGPLAPVWLQASVPDGDLPIPVPEPDVADPGPHLSYAIQWFAFALIGVVGYGALVRSHAHRGQVGARRMEVA